MEKLQKTYMPIKSTGSCQGRIKNIRQVCRSHQYYALYNESNVHFSFKFRRDIHNSDTLTSRRLPHFAQNHPSQQATDAVFF